MADIENKGLSWSELNSALRDKTLNPIINSNGGVKLDVDVDLGDLAKDQLEILAKRYAKLRLKEIVGDEKLDVDTYMRIGKKNSVIYNKKNEIDKLYPSQLTPEWGHVNKGNPLHAALSEIIVERALAKVGVKSVEELTIESFRNGSLSAVVSEKGQVSIIPPLEAFQTESLQKIGAEYAKEKLKEIIGDGYLSINSSGNFDSSLVREKKSDIERIYPNQISYGWEHVNKGNPLHEALSEIIVERLIAKVGVKSVEELTIESFRNGSLSAVVSEKGQVSIIPPLEAFQTESLQMLGAEYAKERLKEIIGNSYLKADNNGRIEIGGGSDNTDKIRKQLRDLYPSQMSDYYSHVERGSALNKALGEIIVEREFAKEVGDKPNTFRNVGNINVAGKSAAALKENETGLQ